MCFDPFTIYEIERKDIGSKLIPLLMRSPRCGDLPPLAPWREFPLAQVRIQRHSKLKLEASVVTANENKAYVILNLPGKHLEDLDR